jgi:PAS domain S-box-containing protein
VLAPWAVVAAFITYCLLLFLVALHTERVARAGRSLAGHPAVYALTLAIYCTSWTYYGSVGKAATSGLLYLAIYLGPTATVTLWWFLLRKLVRIKETQHIASIADLLSARYDRSTAVGAVATVTAVVGITPYLALQLKSLESTYRVITGGGSEGPAFGIGMIALLALFTVYFGARRLDPTERHQGMVVALAVESIVKLVALLAAGIFVTWFMFDGFGDVIGKAVRQGLLADPLPGDGDTSPFILWTTYMTLSGSAILFLPRQFHVSVVENSDERHILTAMWLFPLYMLLINLFVLPIAAGGLLLGLPATSGDTFVLTLPLSAGNRDIAMLVFLGGFSAATAMAIVSTMTVSTMITNHLVAPLADLFLPLAFIRRNLLRCRRAAIVLVLLLGYGFERMVGGSLMLVNMGILSFAAVFQFAPAVIGGLFWTRGNRTGALAGMTGGFAVWCYTLLLPAFVRGGYLPASILDPGPFGLALLAPERLFGFSALDPLSHGVYWALAVNLGLYVAVSVLTAQSVEERQIAEEFADILQSAPEERVRHGGRKADIDLFAKCAFIREILGGYFPPERAAEIVSRCLEELGLPERGKVSVTDLVRFYGLAETYLAGATGAAGAHRAFQREGLLSSDESAALSRAYAGILTDMKLSPQQLRRKIDYYRERETLITRTSIELEEKVRERDAEIQERKKVESTLRRSEARQHLLLEASPDPIASFDEAGLVTYVNPAFTDLFGWSRDELLGRPADFLVPEEARGEDGKASEQLLRDGKLLDFETRRLAKDGQVLDVLLSAATITDARDRFNGTIVFLRDVTDRRKAEEMFHRLAAAVEQATEVIVISDPAGRVQYVNPAFRRFFGPGVPTPASALELAARIRPPEVVTELQRRLSEGLGWKGSLEMQKGDGNAVEAECTATPVRDKSGRVVNFVAVCRDVTTERKIEDHLRQSQKLDAIGTLAGGIAHDFNNILQPLLGYAELARQFLKTDPDAVDGYLENILSGGLRARDLVSQILAFARRAEQERRPVVLQPLVRETMQFLRASIPSSIEIRQAIEAESTGVLADATQLNQVLVNLCTNAAHAMKGGGVLTVRLAEVEVDEEVASALPGLRTGPYALLSVADTGTGMTPEVKARIFEPFFTTKAKGEGTGLGLSVVHGIVQNHEGVVSVRSVEGQGSTFDIYLPRIEIAEEAGARGAEALPRGSESVLFVDDEPMIRDLASESLSLLGYRVVTAVNGADALARFQAAPDAFDIVVTDYTMPDMNGIALAEKLVGIRPGLPIVLCSGFMPALTPAGVKGDNIRRFLMKPLTMRELGTAIRELLQQPQAQ